MRAAVSEPCVGSTLTPPEPPEMRGREGGTLDEMRASIWVADQYAKIGLEPAGDNGTWFQWFNIVRTRVSLASSAVSIAGRAVPLFDELIPLGVVPAEATGRVLWLANAQDTTVDVRGRIVAVAMRSPAPGAIRPTGYTPGMRYANAAISGSLGRLARRGRDPAGGRLARGR